MAVDKVSINRRLDRIDDELIRVDENLKKLSSIKDNLKGTGPSQIVYHHLTSATSILKQHRKDLKLFRDKLVTKLRELT